MGASGHPGDAIEYADMALHLNPSSVPALINKALALNALGRTDEALAHFDRAVHIQPRDPEVWYGRGYVLLTRNNIEGAPLRPDTGPSAPSDPSRGPLRDWRRHLAYLSLARRRGLLRAGGRSCLTSGHRRPPRPQRAPPSPPGPLGPPHGGLAGRRLKPLRGYRVSLPGENDDR